MSRDKLEKNLKTLHKGKAEENRKFLPTSRGAVDSGERTDAARSQVVCLQPASTDKHLTNHKSLQEMVSLDHNLNSDISSCSPVVSVKPSLPHRTWSDEANGNTVPQSAPGRGPEDDALGSERKSCVPQAKPAPAAPRKPAPVPVPRKPRTAALVRQEKVEKEREEVLNQEGREMNIKEVKVSSEGKDSPSPSVSVPVSESKQMIFLSARRACPPPAPPPKKKPFLSAPERVPASAPEPQPKDVVEEDLGWDSSNYEMEVSVDKEDEEVEDEMEGKEDLEAVCSDVTHHPSSSRSHSQPEISQPPAITVAAEDVVVKVPPRKPQRHSTPMAYMERKESFEEREDCALKERVMRELPLPPDKKASRIVKPSRSKPRAKSFSGADLICSEGQRRNSFRKLLDLKLSVKMLPKLIAKGGQNPECTANDNEQSVDIEQNECQNFPQHLRCERKFSCPLVGVEQSVDGDEFSSGIHQHDHYENVRHYEEIPDYMNVHVGKVGTCPRASLSQPTVWDGNMYNDEGIYEEQEPYMSFEKNAGHQQHQTLTDCER